MNSSISVSNIIRTEGAPVFGSYRVRGVVYNNDAGELTFRLCDHSGSLLARINAFVVPYDDPGELEDAVLHAKGAITKDGCEFVAVLESLKETESAIYGTIESLPREVAVCSSLLAFDIIVSRIKSMQNGHTRRFCEMALGHPRVYENFFRVGASRNIHHASPGGLAVHISEMIHELDHSPLLSQLPTWRQDLAIAAAIVHDLPKALDTPKRSGYDPDKNYEDLLNALSVPLKYLDAMWPKGANHVREVLRGFPRASASQTIEAVALWNADRLSAVSNAEKTAFETIGSADDLEVTAILGPSSSRTYQRPNPPPDCHL